MHRITLNIDLDANDLLEKEVIEAIKAETKRLTRERIDDIINKSITEVFENRVRHWDNMDWVTMIKLEKMVDKKALEKLEEYISSGVDKEEINKQIGCRLNAMMSIAEYKLSNMDNKIDAMIESKVNERFNKCFLDVYSTATDRYKREKDNA